MSLSINRWIDQYPFIANEESNITLGLTFFTTSLILFGTRNSNFWYPTPIDLKEIDLSKETKESLMSKLDKGSQLTPVKLRGATITASTMKENNFDVKRAFSAVPGKPIAASDPEGSSVPIPREIAKFYNEIDRSLYDTKELRQSKNDFYLTAGDSKSPTIMVKNDGGEYTNLRYLKTYDNDYYKKVLSDSPINQIIDKAQFNDVRMVLLEGEIITLGGYLHYNSKEDELQIAHIFSIASGCAEKLFDNAFKLYKRNRNMLKYLAGVSLCISVLFLTFSYQRNAYSKKLKERCRQDLDQNGPTEGQECRKCGYYRATVVFLPCYHKRICESCSPKVTSCPDCAWLPIYKAKGKIYTNVIE